MNRLRSIFAVFLICIIALVVIVAGAFVGAFLFIRGLFCGRFWGQEEKEMWRMVFGDDDIHGEFR